jgi:hypothetical protein
VSDSSPPPPRPEPEPSPPDGGASPQHGQGQPPPYGQGQPPPYGPGQPPEYGQPPPYPPVQQQYGQPPPAPPGNEPYNSSYGQTQQPRYPQQELLPHDVKPRRNRVPLVIGLVIALALAGGGVAAWLLLRDNGESTRAQYCAAIKKLVPDGDLTSSLQGGQQDTLASIRKIADLAPNAVADDWKTLTDLFNSAQQSGTPDLTLLLGAVSAAKSIVADSNAHCGTTFKVPSLP